MPRGKYDRKASRIRRLEEELETQTAKAKALKVELDTAKKAVGTVTNVSHQTQDVEVPWSQETFGLLRENLKLLIEARQAVASSNETEVHAVVMTRFDSEIAAHLATLSNYRHQVFGSRVPAVPAMLRNMPMPTYHQAANFGG